MHNHIVYIKTSWDAASNFNAAICMHFAKTDSIQIAVFIHLSKGKCLVNIIAFSSELY